MVEHLIEIFAGLQHVETIKTDCDLLARFAPHLPPNRWARCVVVRGCGYCRGLLQSLLHLLRPLPPLPRVLGTKTVDHDRRGLGGVQILLESVELSVAKGGGEGVGGVGLVFILSRWVGGEKVRVLS